MLAKRMGLHKGASDLFIAWPTSRYYGLWLEIKPDKWKGAQGKKMKLHLDDQLNFISRMNLVGYFAKLVVGVDEAMETINGYVKGTL